MKKPMFSTKHMTLGTELDLEPSLLVNHEISDSATIIRHMDYIADMIRPDDRAAFHANVRWTGLIPIHSQQWCSRHSCESVDCVVVNHRNCKLFSMPDWTHRFSPDFEIDFCFYWNLKRTVEQVHLFKTIECLSMTKREITNANISWKKHPYVIYLLKMQDTEFINYRFDRLFIEQSLIVRKAFSCNGNVVLESFCNQYKAQHLGNDIMDMGASISASILNFAWKAMDGVVSAFTSITDFVAGSFEKVFSWFQEHLGFLGSVGSWFKDTFKTIYDTILNSILVKTYVAPAFHVMAKILKTIVVFALGLALCKMAALSIGNVLGFFYKIFKGDKLELSANCSPNAFEKHGPMDLVTALVVVVGAVFGWKARKDLPKLAFLKNVASYLVTLFAAGTVMSKGVDLIFTLLPVTFQTSLIMRYGSENSKAVYQYTVWKNKVIPALSISEQNDLLGDDELIVILRELIKEGSALLENMQDLSVKTHMIQLFAQLMTAYKKHTANRVEGSMRAEPFCIHLCAAPGIGKSLISGRFMRDIGGYKTTEIFSKSNSDKFWTNYTNQKVVLWDEFLIVNEPDNCSALEYLSLVSAAPFKPSMAAVESKGTSVHPEVVMTINNHPYCNPPEVDLDAMDRRRDVVVLMLLKKQHYKVVEGHKVPKTMGEIHKEDPEAFNRLDHYEFLIMNKFRNQNVGIESSVVGNQTTWKICRDDIKLLSYQAMVDFVKAKKKLKLQDSKTLTGTFNIDKQVTRTGRYAYEQAMREFAQMPQGTMGWTDALTVLAKGGKMKPVSLNSEVTTLSEELLKEATDPYFLQQEMVSHGDVKPTQDPINDDDGYIIVQSSKPHRSRRWNKVEFEPKKISVQPAYQNQPGPSQQHPAPYKRRHPVTNKILNERPPGVILKQQLKDEKKNGNIERECEKKMEELKQQLRRENEQRLLSRQQAQIKVEELMQTTHLLAPEDFQQVIDQAKLIEEEAPTVDIIELGNRTMLDSIREPVLHVDEVDPPRLNDINGSVPAGVNNPVRDIGFQDEGQQQTEASIQEEPQSYELEDHQVPEPPPSPMESLITPLYLQNDQSDEEREQWEPISTGEDDPVDETDALRRRLAETQRDRRVLEERVNIILKANQRLVLEMEQIKDDNALLVQNAALSQRVRTRTPTESDQYETPDDDESLHSIDNLTLAIHEADVPVENNYKTYVMWITEKLKKWGSKVWEHIVSFPDFVTENLAKGVGKGFAKLTEMVTVISLITAGMYMIEVLYRAATKQTPPAEIVFGSHSAVKNPRLSMPHNRGGARTFINGVSSFTSQAALAIQTCTLSVGDLTINCIPIMKNVVLTYTHGAKEIFQKIAREDLKTQNENANLQYNGKIFPVFLCEKKCTSLVEADATFIVINGLNIPSFKKQTDKFVSAKEMSGVSSVHIRIQLKSGTVYSTANRHYSKSYKNDDEIITIDEAWVYSAEAEPGDCGRPLVSLSPWTNKIIGMHVAGSVSEINRTGMSVLITKEDVDSAISHLTNGDVGHCSRKSTRNLFTEEDVAEMSSMPNIKEVELAKPNEVIFMPTRTQYKKTIFYGQLSIPSEKEPAILSLDDPRAKGTCPVKRSLMQVAAIQHLPVDENLVEEIAETVYQNLESTLVWNTGRRLLTHHECVFGIPGKLRALNFKSSAGYPICVDTTKGKQELFCVEQGECVIDEHFKRLSKAYEKRIEKAVDENDYDTLKKIADEHKFIGYMKDELRAPKHIDNVNTRMIYCNDVRANIFFRKYFGCLLTAVAASGGKSIFATGLNPYSYDLDKMYDYLTALGGSKFIAGDYKQFDMHMNPVFRNAAYQVVGKLCHIPKPLMYFLFQHECDTFSQIANIRYKTVSSMFSGCFFTTIVNCIVNDMYMRYCFAKIKPDLIFDEHVRAIYLGDDHVLCVKDVMDFNPVTIADELAKIGQIYTSADKKSELSVFCDSFDKITFLGAHPKKLEFGWCGALKTATLYETVQWSRVKSQHEFTQVLTGALEMASLWGPEYYSFFYNEMQRIQDSHFIDVLPPKRNPLELRRVVAARTAASGHYYFAESANISTKPVEFISQKPVDKTSIHAPGITDITTMAVAEVTNATTLPSSMTACVGINEEEMGLKYGTESDVYRNQFTWRTTDLSGAHLLEVEAPYELLQLGNTDTLQNMPFKNFIYLTTDVAITVQLNGSPFQCGILIVYWRPLCGTSKLQSIDSTNVMSLPHVLLTPNRNVTATLEAPFQYYRNAMNTFAMELNQESLGSFNIMVLAPLKTGTGGSTSATLTIYSRFPRAKFTLPRPPIPLTMTAKSQARTISNSITNSTVSSRIVNMESVAYTSQGGGMSSMTYNSTFNNTYDHTTIAGSAPATTMNMGGNTCSAAGPTVETSVPINMSGAIPLDNPPFAGGAVPTTINQPPLSRNRGLKFTTKLDMADNLLNLQHLGFYDPALTDLSTLCARECILGTFSWSDTSDIGTKLFEVDLNSTLLTTDQYNTLLNSEPKLLPMNLCLLNMFRYWRADFVFTFRAARTNYHSGRLTATIGYGAPTSVVLNATRSQFKNEILTFEADNDVVRIRVPYNSATEYLCTYRGTGFVNQIQDYSLGTMALFVANKLVAPPTVTSSIDVIVSIQLENLEVYELNSNNSVYFADTDIKARNLVSTTGLTYVAQGPTSETNVQVITGTAGEDSGPIQTVTASETKMRRTRPYQDREKRKFPYIIRDLHEVLRRYYRVGNHFLSVKTTTSEGGNVNILCLPVTPLHPLVNMFGAWAGSLHYRLFVSSHTQFGSQGITKVWVTYGPEMETDPDHLEPVWNGYEADTGVSSNATLKYSGATTGWLCNSKYAGSTSVLMGGAPTEMPTGSDFYQKWMDISVPFASQYQMAPTIEYNESNANYTKFFASNVNQAAGISPIIGWIYVQLSPDAASFRQQASVFQAVGDDFRLLVYKGCNTAYQPYKRSGTGTFAGMWNNVGYMP
ncbi:hypothetical protein [Changjiang picorna-like virus 5]|uniref:hypothetical protein n=1 Tax=Changjiang picorna-like virus 5 TaxID=1922794 RepID=UPI00090B7505|nr:hypothetical protein [Changjiang picorna-like virus 5]APG79018.1 hypothetical protein [Changjiang picorna-like virus 5]